MLAVRCRRVNLFVGISFGGVRPYNRLTRCARNRLPRGALWNLTPCSVSHVTPRRACVSPFKRRTQNVAPVVGFSTITSSFDLSYRGHPRRFRGGRRVPDLAVAGSAH